MNTLRRSLHKTMARLRAYVGWLNSQLRKEEGSVPPRRVSDLRNDLRDGVILSHLVATLGGDTVPGIEPHPKNDTEAKENVERLFRFLLRKGVNLYTITPKEVCEGDLKAIMRLVHAVASHYKPDTVLNPPRSYSSRKEDMRTPKKSCKVLPLQITSNLCPQRQNSKSEPTSLDSSYRLSESFIDQLLHDVRQTKKQLLLLQEIVKNERKTCTDSLNENLQDENIKLKKVVEEKEQEIARLKMTLSNQSKHFKYSSYSVPARIQREELQVVAEALGSLRRCFPANDPRQHTLDTVDQSLAALLERINALEMASTTTLMSSPLLRRPISENETCHNLTQTFQGECSDDHHNEFSGTKVVYYMDKSLTPFRCTLNKRIGEATLRDFKLLFDRPGQFRYHFKTLDPEFGMVKEEVLNDDDLLPGWDFKIVAWIEEECS